MSCELAPISSRVWRVECGCDQSARRLWRCPRLRCLSVPLLSLAVTSPTVMCLSRVRRLCPGGVSIRAIALIAWAMAHVWRCPSCAGSFSQSVLIRLEAWNTGADGIDRAPRHGWRSCAARCSRRPARGATGTAAHCRAGSEKCPKSVPGPVWIQTWRLPVNRDLQRWCILSPTGP